MKLVYYSDYESLPYAIVKRFAESVLQKEYFTGDDEKRMNRMLLHKKRYSSFTGMWHLHLADNGLLQQEWWVEPLVQNEEEIRAKLEEHKQAWEEKLTSSGLSNLISYAKAALICNQLGLPLDNAKRVIYYGDDLVDVLFSVIPRDDIDLKPSWIAHKEKYPNPKGAQSQFCLNYFNQVLIEAKVFNPSQYTSKSDNQYSIWHHARLKVNPMTLNDALSIMSLARPRPRKDAYFTSPKFFGAQNAIIDWLINEWDVQEYSHIPISNQERFIQRFPGLDRGDFQTIREDLIQSGIVDGPLLSEGTLLTRNKETIQHRLRCYLESGLSDKREERTDREYDTTKSEAIFREKISELNQSSIVNIQNCNSPSELIQFMLNHNFEIFRLSRRESAIIYARGLIFPLILGFLFPYAGFLLFCIQALRSQKKIRESQAQIENSSEAEEVWRKIRTIIPFIPAST